MTTPYHVTDDHLMGFGAIINSTAILETTLELLILRLIGSDPIKRQAETANAMILMSKLQTKAKTDFLKTLDGEAFSWSGTGLTAILDDLKPKTDLRNNVAHCEWVPGKRPSSIKPIFVGAFGKLRLLGGQDNEKDWTAAELKNEANEIAAIDHRLAIWMKAHDMIFDFKE